MSNGSWSHFREGTVKKFAFAFVFAVVLVALSWNRSGPDAVGQQPAKVDPQLALLKKQINHLQDDLVALREKQEKDEKSAKKHREELLAELKKQTDTIGKQARTIESLQEQLDADASKRTKTPNRFSKLEEARDALRQRLDKLHKQQREIE